MCNKISCVPSQFFRRPFVKRFALCYRTVVLSVLSCPVCLSVCNVGVLWPNGWMHQDATWHEGSSQPMRHCVRWGPSSPRPKRGHSSPSLCGPCIVAKGLDESRCHLVWRWAAHLLHILLCFFLTVFRIALAVCGVFLNTSIK